MTDDYTGFNRNFIATDQNGSTSFAIPNDQLLALL